MTLAVNIAQGGSNNVTFRNRIINGGMVIDQRNAGASTTSGTNNGYTLDRWATQNNSGASRFTVQRNAGSITPPAGYSNYLGCTSTGAYTVSSSDAIGMIQRIEGYNVSDLAWGTANAKAVTLSFWVYSSLTGIFGGSIYNGDGNYSYPFTYTISSANTWQQITLTLIGAPAGTWNTTTSTGINVLFALGTGSTLSGTAGSWSANGYYGATGQTQWVATNGATFYITGVQLEAGTTASPFEYRQYGTELALCQRYYEKSFAQGTAPTEGIDNNFQTGGVGYAGNGLYIPNVGFKVTKRTTATVTIYRPNVVATNGNFAVYNGAWTSSTTTVNSANDTTFSVNLSSNITQNNGYAILGAWTASAEL